MPHILTVRKLFVFPAFLGMIHLTVLMRALMTVRYSLGYYIKLGIASSFLDLCCIWRKKDY